MAILSIDTSETQCAAALLTEDGGSFSKAEDIGRGHAERLLPMIEEVLEDANLNYSDLSRIAVVTGPGTFTGLRIGLSVARGLAFALDIPCVGVMSLQVLAATAYENGHKGLVHAVVKGRAGQVFYQAYKDTDQNGLPIPFTDAMNIDADEAAGLIKESQGLLVGTGVPLLAPYLPEETTGFVYMSDLTVLAAQAQHLPVSEYLPEPAYLRPADAIKAKPIFQVQAD